jgi:hypothetical protein
VADDDDDDNDDDLFLFHTSPDNNQNAASNQIWPCNFSDVSAYSYVHRNSNRVMFLSGCAVALTVRLRPLTVESWVLWRVTSYGIRSGRSNTVSGYFSEFVLFSPDSYDSTIAPYSPITAP